MLPPRGKVMGKVTVVVTYNLPDSDASVMAQTRTPRWHSMAPSRVLAMTGFDRGGWESARITVDGSGKATLFSGSMSLGHGHATALAQIAADALQIPFDDIAVVQGDTRQVQAGHGTFNSRSMAVGGSSAARLRGAARRRAAGDPVAAAGNTAAHESARRQRHRRKRDHRRADDDRACRARRPGTVWGRAPRHAADAVQDLGGDPVCPR